MLNALCLTQPGVAQPLVDITILIWSRQDFFATINIIHVKLIQAQKYAIFCLENVTRPMVMKMIHLDLLLHKVQTFPIVIVVIHKCKGKWYYLGFRCLQSALVEWWELRMMAGDSIGTHYSCLLLCTLPLKNPISLRQKGKQCSWRQIIETTRLIYKKPSGSSHWNLKAIQIA